jgi:hypothetical protein
MRKKLLLLLAGAALVALPAFSQAPTPAKSSMVEPSPQLGAAAVNPPSDAQVPFLCTMAGTSETATSQTMSVAGSEIKSFLTPAPVPASGGPCVLACNCCAMFHAMSCCTTCANCQM